MSGSETIERHDPARPAWWQAPARMPAAALREWQASAAFLLTAVSIGLIAADQGGYFQGAWRVATPLYALVVAAILAAGDLRLARSALLCAAGLAGLAVWTGASWLWSIDQPATVQDVRLVAVYVAGGTALLLMAAAGRGVAVAGGVVLAVTAVDVFSITSRLYPHTFGMYETGGGYGRLYQPLGYWNALGSFTVIGIMLALGFAARGTIWVRMLAAAALVPLAPTLYLTFSRGALVGLAAGLIALVALDRDRVQLIAGAAAGSVGAVGALLAVHGHSALTRYNRSENLQATQGAQVAARMISLVPLAMGSAALFAGLGERFPLSRAGRRIAGVAMALAACAAIAAGVRTYGSPVGFVHDVIKTWDKPAPTFPKNDLNLRLFSISPNGRVIFWKGAWHDFRAHPAVGSGGGTFRRYWFVHRPVRVQVRNAHSLFLETLAELGVAGLAILLVALLPPLWAGLRRRAHPMSAPIMAAYVAFLVHAGGDWTWQLPAVGLAGLACAAACTGLGENGSAVTLGRAVRRCGVVVAVALGALAAWGG